MKTWKKCAIGLGIVTLLTPLGLLTKGTAWGEWSSVELERLLGYSPGGLRKLETLWHARLADYGIPGCPGTLGYLASAVIGVALISGVAWIIGRFLAKERQDAA